MRRRDLPQNSSAPVLGVGFARRSPQIAGHAACEGACAASHRLVFCREDGTALWPRSFSRMFDRHAGDAELPGIPLKNLRHTHATILLANSVHPKVIQERLGHADITITLRTYAHAIPAMHAEATAKAAALIDG